MSNGKQKSSVIKKTVERINRTQPSSPSLARPPKISTKVDFDERVEISTKTKRFKSHGGEASKIFPGNKAPASFHNAESKAAIAVDSFGSSWLTNDETNFTIKSTVVKDMQDKVPIGSKYFAHSHRKYTKKEKDKILELILQDQTKKHMENVAFHHVMSENIIELEKLLKKKPGRLNDRDPAGATLVHIAYLYKKNKVAHWLVRNYPKLGLCSYCQPEADHWKIKIEGEHDLSGLKELMYASGDGEDGKELRLPSTLMPYTGESILHMAIVHRNHAEVAWLLDFYKDHKDSVPNGLYTLLTAKATGFFFSEDYEYFGQYPLHFAVCCDDETIFDIVLSHAAYLDGDGTTVDDGATSVRSVTVKHLGPRAIFSCDDYGNNALHLCVKHRLKDMFKHVKSIAARIIERELLHKKAESKQEGKEHTVEPFFPVEDQSRDPGPPYTIQESPVVFLKGVFDLEFEVTKKLQERLLFVLNKDFHSPLTLAASMLDRWVGAHASKSNTGKERKERHHLVEMLEFVIDEERTCRWTYGPVQCVLIRLEGFERKHDFTKYPKLVRLKKRGTKRIEMHGVVQWLCRSYSYEAMKIHAIRELITTKWMRIGRSNFMINFYVHASLSILLTIISWYPYANLTLSPNWHGEWIVSLCYPLSGLVILAKMSKEFAQVWKYGLLSYWGWDGYVRSSAQFDKISLSALSVSFWIAFALKLVISLRSQSWRPLTTNKNYAKQYPDSVEVQWQSSPWSVNASIDSINLEVSMIVFLQICVASAWLKMIVFLIGFSYTAPFILTIQRIICVETPYFLIFYLAVMVAFTCPMMVLTNHGDPNAVMHFLEGFWGLIRAHLNVGPMAPEFLSHLDIQQVQSHLHWLYDIILTFFYAVVVLMMNNLLIAMINASYVDLDNDSSNGVVLIEHYNIMAAMERSQSQATIASWRERYTVNIESDAIADSAGLLNEEATTFSAKGDASRSSQLPKEPSASGKGKSHESGAFSKDSITPATPSTKTSSAGIVLAFEYQGNVHDWWTRDKREKSAVSDIITLLIIDPQVDFHPEGGTPDTASYHKAGSLPVPGADEDSARIAGMIRSNLGKIKNIIVTLDSHHVHHIAHSSYWRWGDGGPRPEGLVEIVSKGEAYWAPPPFTKISHDDFVRRKWVPVDSSAESMRWMEKYLRLLQRAQKIVLTIWPEHCIIGSSGHCVVPVINDALQEWCLITGREVKYVMKGQNPRTEWYSAFQAEVPDDRDYTTRLNDALLEELRVADKILICGQALSHCVNRTTRDLVTHWHKPVGNIVLLEDGSSSVKGFESEGETFLADMIEAGVTVTTTSNAFAHRSNMPTEPHAKEIMTALNDMKKSMGLQTAKMEEQAVLMQEMRDLIKAQGEMMKTQERIIQSLRA